MNQSLLTVNELSSFLSMHPKTVYKQVAEGKIPYFKKNGSIRFKIQDIDEWLEKGKIHPINPQEILPKYVISLKEYDKIYLKGRSVLRKKSKRCYYGIGSTYSRKTKDKVKRWYIDYRDENGKRIQKVVKHAKSEEEAEIALENACLEAFAQKHHVKLKYEKIMFNEFSEVYLRDYAMVKKRAFERADKSYLRANLIPYFGNSALSSITPKHIESYISKRLDEGVKKSTINRELACLRKMFNKAIDWEYLSENPISKVGFFSEKAFRREKILTHPEEKNLLESCSEHLRPILITAIHTGMRKGEILNLKWRNVDITNREIRVENTKNERPRLIPINDVLFRELSILKRKRGKSEYLFTNPDSRKPFTDVKKAFKGACKRAEIEGFRFHDLRHTFASRLVERGVDLITVKDLLGHSSIRVTERYTHTNKRLKKEAVEVLSKTAQKEKNLLRYSDIGESTEAVKNSIPLFSIN